MSGTVCLLSVGRGICACSSARYRGIQRASRTQKTEKAKDCRFSGMLVIFHNSYLNLTLIENLRNIPDTLSFLWVEGGEVPYWENNCNMV